MQRIFIKIKLTNGSFTIFVKKGCGFMPLPKGTQYTTEFIYNLPEGERAELIDGQIYYMAPPSREHQKLIMNLSATIHNYINSKSGLCEVYPAPFAVFLNKDDKTYVEPDISVICDKSKLDDKGCVGAPDWIIEIVSPSSIRHDYLTKAHLYETTKVREYWIVDIDKQRITVHNFENQTLEEFSFSDIVKAGIYEDLYINFRDIAK